MRSKYSLSSMLFLAAASAPLSASVAAGFAAGISPSRFELDGDPGDVLRDTFTIVNPAAEEADYLFRTADWRLDENGGVHFDTESLAADSCRPWVRLERRNIRLTGGDRKNYRFEVHVPEGAAAGLCRFAILVEAAEPYLAQSGDGAIAMPIVGRYAIITYVTIGDAAPEIEFLGLTTTDNAAARTPAMTLRNTGATHGRASGQVTATDAAGNRSSLVPSTFPLLPGRTELIELLPDSSQPGGSVTSSEPLSYPLQLRGRIDIGGQVFRIDEIID